MKITKLKTFIVDGGFRNWLFVKIETDSGIVGWGDCTPWDATSSVAALIEDLSSLIIGENPLNSEYLWWKMTRACYRHLSGIGYKAMTGIDTALWDIRGKYYDAPVWQLLGGSMHERVNFYWTHFGITRHYWPQHIDKPPVRNADDLGRLCEEAKAQGITAVKCSPMPQFYGFRSVIPSGGYPYETLRPFIRAVHRQIDHMSQALGPDIEIAMDIAFALDTKGVIRLARELEEYDLMWLEAESFNPDATRMIRESTSTPICLGESLFGTSQFKPFLDKSAVDIIMPDLAWNGITMGKKIADLAHTYDVLFAPHNCHSPLSTMVTAHVCMSIPNFYRMEFEFEDVPWRDDILTHPFEVSNGSLKLADRPGLGTDLIEEELKKHPGREFTSLYHGIKE